MTTEPKKTGYTASRKAKADAKREARGKSTTRKVGIGDNVLADTGMTADQCHVLARRAFNEVDTINRMEGTSIQEMAAACMGYHANMSRPPALALYVDPNQEKARAFLFGSMWSFFVPEPVKAVQPPTPENSDAMTRQSRYYTLVQRGLEMAAFLAKDRITLDSFDNARGMWSIPLRKMCTDGYEPTVDKTIKTCLLENVTWLAMKPAKPATKDTPATKAEIERWFSSYTRYLLKARERAAPKAPVTVTTTVTPGTPATSGTPATAPGSTTPAAPTNGNGDTNGERDTRLPKIEAASQTIAGWCNAAIKELRATDDGKLVYGTLKDLPEPDREALVLLVKIYDDMVKRGQGKPVTSPTVIGKVDEAKAA